MKKRKQIMVDWREQANRGLSLLQDDSSDAGMRTKSIINHVLDDNNHDDYISKDFFNVQQTAGGLPDTVTFDQFLAMVTGHVRQDFGSGGFDADVSDDDFRTLTLTIDQNIRRHIQFLNGVVHQIAAGDVHKKLWQLILDSRSDDQSIYACYRDYLVDA
jgi:hypothetical protein